MMLLALIVGAHYSGYADDTVPLVIAYVFAIVFDRLLG